MPRLSSLFPALLPAHPLARVRLLLLVVALGSTGAAVAGAVAADQPLVVRLGAALLGLAISAHWVVGYRRRGFVPWGEPVEAGALFLLLSVVPGEPFFPLFGLVFRSLYGSLPVALARYGLWVAALLGAHAPRGEAHFEADLARAIGLLLAPGVMHTLSAALASLEANERRLRSLVQNSTDVVTVIGSDLRVRWQADSIRSVLGHQPSDVLNEPLLGLVHHEDHPDLERYFAEADGRPGHARTLALRVRHGRGGYRHMEVAAANRLHDESVGGFVLNMRDATERLRLEAELHTLAADREHDALHDPLTGLANRRQLYGRLADSLAKAGTHGSVIALLLIDLDQFKELNDTLGHAAGDRLLCKLGPRLAAALGDADLVARVGGDEFAVLLPAGSGATAAVDAAERLLGAIQQPFGFQGLTLRVRASVGIALYPEHAEDVETLMQRADVAMYAAKSRGGGLEIYNASRDGHSKQRLALIGELPDAIATGQLVVHYQPKVDLLSGAIAGAEALVRWEHPRHGLLGPGAFLPMAEQIGVMRPLTLYVLDRALAECARWQDESLSMTIAVNLSAPNLLDLALPSDVAKLLDKWKIEPRRLQLEVTETIIGADPVRVGEIIAKLRELGISLSLDDFGTGSSSLSNLRELPVDELKIDKSFVLAMSDDEQAAAIVRTIIDLAHDLGMRAVAEGIETDAVRERLLADGCDYGQGFLLGRPIPADELLARMRATSLALDRPALALPELRAFLPATS